MLKNQTSWSKLVRPWFLHTGIIKCRTTDDVTLTLVNDLRSGIWHTVRSHACTCNLSISFLSKLLHVIWQKRRRADWWTDWRRDIQKDNDFIMPTYYNPLHMSIKDIMLFWNIKKGCIKTHLLMKKQSLSTCMNY